MKALTLGVGKVARATLEGLKEWAGGPNPHAFDGKDLPGGPFMGPNNQNREPHTKQAQGTDVL